ncbi:OLC1v1012605C1 [Oldenlandia corymbosa var. corymbosa]|uniref:OLC1v1012605C1 n=1 Tax=Oldenlandia corymbosa var. corymbosa TaxID=529605 RepID=A0AAV1DW93_OLDCO|nr:OLC1v1012605C1 [Oldenlandia corymbosa var. corymbosa]
MKKSVFFAAMMVVVFFLTGLAQAADRGDGRGKCQQEVEAQLDRIRGCTGYLTYSEGRGGWREGQRNLDACCQGIRTVSEECRCAAARQAEWMITADWAKGEIRERMRKTANSLPQKCKVPPYQCNVY